MTKKLRFTKIAKLKFGNKTFQMFQTKNGQIAFLEFLGNDKYSYPEYEDFYNLISIFSNKNIDTSYFDIKKTKNFLFTPKIKHNFKLVVLTSALIMSTLTGCSQEPNMFANDYATYGSYDLEGEGYDLALEEEYDYEEQEEDLNPDFYMTEDFEVIKSSEFVQLFNTRYYEKIFGMDNPTIEELNKIIDSNKEIPKELKAFIKDYVERMNKTYPNLEFRLFVDNLKTLKIEERNQEDIELTTSGLAFYNHSENKMVISKEADVYSDPRAKIILAHELGHLFNNGELSIDGFFIKINFNHGNRGMYTKEGLDVIFTSEPYKNDPGVQELDSLGYAITTNNMRIIVDCLPNYDIQDSITNNVYYLQRCMDEFMPNDIEASRIIELLELQWIEYSSELIEVDEQEYIDLYGYITRMYIKKNINEDMTFAEIEEHKQQLIYKLSLDVTNPAYVYTDVIEEEFHEYMKDNNIEMTLYTK